MTDRRPLSPETLAAQALDPGIEERTGAAVERATDDCERLERAAASSDRAAAPTCAVSPSRAPGRRVRHRSIARRSSRSWPTSGA